MLDGKLVLVTGASRGIGKAIALTLGKAGATVIGTVSTKEKELIAKQNGCHHTINYLEEDFKEKVLEITNNQGVDVIYDSVGKDTFSLGLKCLAPKGRLVSFGVSSGPIGPIDLNTIRPISGSISTGGLNTFIKKHDDMQQNANHLFDLLYKEEIKVNISEIIPIDDIKQAQHKMENRLTTGSIVLSF